MKLTAREVNIIKSSGADWSMMTKFLFGVKKVFPNSMLLNIKKTEPKGMPATNTAMTIQSPEMNLWVGLSKGGAPLKKKRKEQPMLLPLKPDRNG